MFDIGDEQFLMLLLMMKAENEDRFDFIEQLFVRVGKQIVDMRIDRCAITLCLPLPSGAKLIRADRAGACHRRRCSMN